MKFLLPTLFLLIIFISCSDDDSNPDPQDVPSAREYKMGFTSWPYGPNLEDVNDTYTFIENNADIYAEHIDNNIPWSAWINDESLPAEFANDIAGKAARKIPGKEMLLSVSILTSDRNELASDVDGSTPNYTSIDDTDIKNAYYKHIKYLIEQFNPDYLVIAIEVNELRLNAPEKWQAYTNLITEVKGKIKQDFPNLKIAESVSLHNYYEPDVSDPQSFISDISNQINQNDFIAISFYPYFKNLKTKEDFQKAFDFLYSEVNLPIAFVETSHIAEDLEIPNLNVSIAGNEAEQSLYLECLLENAESQNFEFIIWWCHRDFDALWETFPEEVKDLGRIWRDTGLLDEDGNEREAYSLWKGYQK